MLTRMGFWVKEFRLIFLLFAVVPVATGSLVAHDYYPSQFSWYYFGLSLIAIVLLHAGTIAFNDFFDNWTGADRINKERTPFTGGTGLLVDGSLKPSHVLAAGCLCFLLCIAIGMYIVFTRSPIVFIFGVIGVALGAFYTAPPLKLAYRLLGEITWFLSFPLAALGAFFTQVPPASPESIPGMSAALAATVAAILPLAFLATAGFFVLEFPDYNADRASKKIGVTVTLGKRNTVYAFLLMCLLAYISLVLAIYLDYLPVISLTVLVTIPLLLWVWTGLTKYLETPVRLVPYIVVGAGAIYLACGIVLAALIIG